MKKLILFGIFVTLTGTLGAQEFPRFAFDAGAGFTTPVGNTGSSLDVGWNVRGGVGYNFAPWLGAMVDFGFDNMGINSTSLAGLAVGGGTVRVFSTTFDPIVHLTPKRHFDLYVTGGGGFYRKVTSFTDPEEVEECYYFCGIGYENVVVSHFSSNKGGLNIGVGFSHKLGRESTGGIGRTRLFAEARYLWINTPGFSDPDGLGTTGLIPVTIGVRY